MYLSDYIVGIVVVSKADVTIVCPRSLSTYYTIVTGWSEESGDALFEFTRELGKYMYKKCYTC